MASGAEFPTSRSRSARTSSPTKGGKRPGRCGWRGSSRSSFRDIDSALTTTTLWDKMQIRLGYELDYELPQPTPMILTLNVHHSRISDVVRPDRMKTTPSVPTAAYRDKFGN